MSFHPFDIFQYFYLVNYSVKKKQYFNDCRGKIVFMTTLINLFIMNATVLSL